ncbi:MAG: Bug family tripartite tricarboxylate transporter substrate binding protein [Burkholderiales bacterium]
MLLVASHLLAASVAAQDAFPNRPIRIVVTFPAGGGPDIAARIVAAKMSGNIGQGVVVENRAGASGIVGAEHVAKSAPDGYTIMLATPAPMTIAGGSGRKLNYDPLKDFAGVTQGVLQTPLLVIAPNAPYRTTADLIAAARSRPGVMNFGSAGVGNSQHLAGELFNQMAGINTVHVPYTGTALGLTAIMAGQIDFYFSDPSAMPLIRAGKLRALAVSTVRRSANLPDVPTVAESGLPGYEYTNWYGFVVPAKTPRAIIQYLNREIVQVLNTPDIRERLVAAGMDPAPSSPEELDAFLPRDQEKWARVVRAANIKFD